MHRNVACTALMNLYYKLISHGDTCHVVFRPKCHPRRLSSEYEAVKEPLHGLCDEGYQNVTQLLNAAASI